MSALHTPIDVLALCLRRRPRPYCDRPDVLTSRRVSLLILAILMMSLADLICTITYMRAVGMVELNPIARYLTAAGDGAPLVAFKSFTMVLSAWLLFVCRRHRRAEVCAWLGASILLVLTGHWVHYNSTVQGITREIVVIANEFERLKNLPAPATAAAGIPEAWVKLDL